MRIVFSYIDGHKNLEKSQFDFDPNFKYLFKEEKIEIKTGTEIEIKKIILIKKEKRKTFNQHSDFFGNRISNITGIIGVNGSGKTSILEAIFNESGKTNIKNKTFKYLVLFKDSENNYSYISTEEKDIYIEDEKEKKLIVKLNEKINYLYIDNNLSKKNQDFTNKNTLINKSDLSSSYFLKKEKEGIHGYAKKDLKLVIRLLARHNGKNILSEKLKIEFPKFLCLKFSSNNKTQKYQKC